METKDILHCVVFSIRDTTNNKEYFTTDLEYLNRFLKDKLNINQTIIFLKKFYKITDIQIKNITNETKTINNFGSNRIYLGETKYPIRYNLRVHILIKELPV